MHEDLSPKSALDRRFTDAALWTSDFDIASDLKALASNLNLNRDEEEMLQKIACRPSNLSDQLLLVAWSRALATYGIPASFYINATNFENTFNLGSAEYPCVTIDNKNHELRRKLITAQTPYQNKLEQSEYPSKLSLGADGCKLCENVAQAYDSLRQKSYPDSTQQQSNILIDSPTAFVLPNKYPAFPLHSLWIPKFHDDFTLRAKSHEESGMPMRLPPEIGKTRGQLINPKHLFEISQICDSLQMIAVRNHPLDGMSLPAHDHFHLEPEFAFPQQYFENLLSLNSSSITLEELKTSPFATLVVRGKDRFETAKIAAAIMNRLELSNQVWTTVYVRGAQLITPRIIERMNDTLIQVGAGISIHHFNPDKAMNLVNMYVPLRGEFNWQPYLP